MSVPEEVQCHNAQLCEVVNEGERDTAEGDCEDWVRLGQVPRAVAAM
jgi:hypothetical protein